MRHQNVPLFDRPFEAFPAISQEIWERKYRFQGAPGQPADDTIEDTWKRVASAVASVERPAKRGKWQARFYEAMQRFEFLPAGRILAGAGTGRNVTLFNCFVMGTIEDDMGSIFENLREAGLTMQRGGGIGHDFSTLRPHGAPVRGVGAQASGPVSFMQLWDTMCETIMSAGARRGAMMATMRCDHPDIEAFITAKQKRGALTNFNLSVLVTDAFIEAIDADEDWPLVFEGTVYRTVRARDLWDRITRATYDAAEPGVIFIDRINRENNLRYCETISATNPCGEQPLPPHGACLLGSINLAALVRDPFSKNATLDMHRLKKRVQTAVRFMDNVIDLSRYPLPEQEAEAQAKRRIGLGVTGLADALIMCGLVYGSTDAVAATRQWLKAVRDTAYATSARLARKRGAFPLCDTDQLLRSPNIAALPKAIRKDIAGHGLRNGLLTSIAPTGTISLLAGNVSSGIEPVFDFTYQRRVKQADGRWHEQTVEDAAHLIWQEIRPRSKQTDVTDLPPAFVTAQALPTSAHIAMQAAAQTFIDSAISKTINCPPDISFADFQSVYREAYDTGLKGCTTFRPNDVTGSVLATTDTTTTASTANDTATTDTKMPAASARSVSGAAPPETASDDPGIVYLSDPMERPEHLQGSTYKLKWPASSHAYYVTVNDIVDGRGIRRPFEIFINSKNLEHDAWIVALTRMISAVFRRGGDVSFVVEELQQVFDPNGGHWRDGTYVPSLIAAIGAIIENHMRSIDFLKREEDEDRQLSLAYAAGHNHDASAVAPPGIEHGQALDAPCPQCGENKFTRREGCFVCLACGYSRCG